MCVKGDHIGLLGPPEEVFSDSRISELYELETGSFNTLFGSVELMAPSGEPQTFVLAGAGKGIPIYRMLQKHGIPFATGILFENDIDMQIARVLSKHVVSASAFSIAGEQEIAEAKRYIDRMRYIIDAGTPLGQQNERCRELKDYAVRHKKLILTAVEACEQMDRRNPYHE